MNRRSVFQQSAYRFRYEWGPEGVRTLAPVSDLVVIVDVLSFTTCVDVVLNRGGTVFPFPERDEAAVNFAQSVGAILAGRRGEPISLSPALLSTIPEGSRIVLPSPNGATCSFLAKETGATVIAACLRNAAAVARFIEQHGGTVAVIACGERWPDGSLRPSFEDLLGAGAVLSQFAHEQLSPEARAAAVAYLALKDGLPELLKHASSGRELTEWGYSADVAVASMLDASRIVPILGSDGGFTRWRPIPS